MSKIPNFWVYTNGRFEAMFEDREGAYAYCQSLRDIGTTGVHVYRRCETCDWIHRDDISCTYLLKSHVLPEDVFNRRAKWSVL